MLSIKLDATGKAGFGLIAPTRRAIARADVAEHAGILQTLWEHSVLLYEPVVLQCQQMRCQDPSVLP